MSEGIPYADILILALIAGFILLRLRSVLGRKTDDEESGLFKDNIRAQTERETVVTLSNKLLKPRSVEEEEPDTYLQNVADKTVADTLKMIKASDDGFSASGFLQGAKMAFEMVFDGFAKGDKAPLKMLLSDELYAQFESEINARTSQDTKTETTLVSVTAKDICKAEFADQVARLTVTFSSEQITVKRDKDGKIVEGDPSDVREAQDEWTFERNIASKNPNWKIIDT